jgi:FixJ family two-component response regulator
MREPPSGTPERRIILVVDPDFHTRKAATHLAKPVGSTVECGSFAEAQAAVNSGMHFVCGLVEPGLPDGDGLELVARLGTSDPELPVLVMTASAESSVTNRATVLGARVARKPKHLEPASSFLRDVMIDFHMKEPADRTLFRVWARGRSRPLGQLQMILLKARGFSRKEIAERAGVTIAEIKSRANLLLREEHANNLASLAERILGRPAGGR